MADAYPPAAEVEGLTYLKCPLVDGGDLPDPALTLRLAALVAGLVEEGHRALVHCTFGRNRSGLVAALIVRELLGVSGEEARAAGLQHDGGERADHCCLPQRLREERAGRLERGEGVGGTPQPVGQGQWDRGVHSGRRHQHSEGKAPPLDVAG